MLHLLLGFFIKLHLAKKLRDISKQTSQAVIRKPEEFRDKICVSAFTDQSKSNKGLTSWLTFPSTKSIWIVKGLA